MAAVEYKQALRRLEMTYSLSRCDLVLWEYTGVTLLFLRRLHFSFSRGRTSFSELCYRYTFQHVSLPCESYTSRPIPQYQQQMAEYQYRPPHHLSVAQPFNPVFCPINLIPQVFPYLV